MSDSENVTPFFVNQEVEVIHAVTVKNNVFITVEPNSMIRKPENIESLLTVGTTGRILEVEKDNLLLYFFADKPDAIRIRVKRVHFGLRFKATKNIFV